MDPRWLARWSGEAVWLAQRDREEVRFCASLRTPPNPLSPPPASPVIVKRSTAAVARRPRPTLLATYRAGLGPLFPDYSPVACGFLVRRPCCPSSASLLPLLSLFATPFAASVARRLPPPLRASAAVWPVRFSPRAMPPAPPPLLMLFTSLLLPGPLPFPPSIPQLTANQPLVACLSASTHARPRPRGLAPAPAPRPTAPAPTVSPPRPCPCPRPRHP